MNEWRFFVQMVGTQSWQVWVSLKENIKMVEDKMAKFKTAEFKMAAIIKLSQNEWVKFFFVQIGWIHDGRIQDGRILDGCHLQVNQIELVWVRVRVEWECYRVNLREDNKVSESKMAVSETNMTEFNMAAIIKLSQNKWMKCFVQMVGTNLGKCDWVWKKILRLLNPRWPNSRWQYSRWLPLSIWIRMNEWSFFCAYGGNQSWQVWVNLKGKIKMLNPRWPNSRWPPSSS